MIYFQNRDLKRNVGTSSGKKFVVEFEIKSYVLREDGSRELVKEDASLDLLTFLKDEKRELVAYLDKESIVW
jgi:hypothetical protein